MPITETPITWESCRQALEALASSHPFARLQTIGTTAYGRSLLALTLGNGPRRVLFSAAHHANEWITASVLLKYAQTLCQGIAANDPQYQSLARVATVCMIPMVDPDGVDLVNGAIPTDSPAFTQARQIADGFPAIPFPQGWKANLDGVDLNLNYPAGWLEARTIKFSQGFTRPAPRDYVGRWPLSQPETKAMADFTTRFDPAAVVALHTQGEVIYWQFRDYATEEARLLGEAMASVSGYALADTPYESSFAGYKDWFLQEFRRPGYTVELGLGENPLPLSQFPQIYRQTEPLLNTVALWQTGP